MTIKDSLFSHWKTTIMGLATCGFAIERSVHFNEAGRLAMTQKDWFGVSLGALIAYAGICSKDAGTTVAEVPGQGVEAVTSHEIPDQPNATPVKELSHPKVALD